MTLHTRVAERAPAAAAPVPAGRRGVRPAILGAVCVAAVAVSVSGVVFNRDATRSTPSTALPATPERLAAVTGTPFLVFRSTSLDRDYGRVALRAADDPTAQPIATSMSCDRVDFAAGRGLCLTRNLPGKAGGSGAIVFDAALRATATLPLAGSPSRAKVSPDGRYGAVTRFVRGDTYASLGQFSTRTDILDLTSGTSVLSLEKLTVTKDGKRLRGVDFNYWGVTFLRDSKAFYATLGTGDHTYLVLADLRTRQARVVTDGVECPSLSPDGTRIAFKERDLGGDGVSWHLSVLDLSTLARQRLATTDNVDDQATWRNDQTVAYGQVDAGVESGTARAMLQSWLASGGSVATTTWTVPADGSGAPQRDLTGAWSAALVRP